MPLHNPNYDYEEKVRLNFPVKWKDKTYSEVEGTIATVDSSGIFEDNTQCYYDVFIELDGETILYKHIKESNLLPL